MNIEEFFRLKSISPQFDGVIELDDIANLEFYNTSFREFLTVYKGYIIAVYPFSISIGTPMSYEFYKLFGVSNSYLHHNDFLSNDIKTDPCDVYEKVSGVKIHHGESDSYMMNIDHSDTIRQFEGFIITEMRNDKLKGIGI